MKTLLITLEFPPFKGGVANYYGNLANYWPIGENLSVINNNQGELQQGTGLLAWWPALGMIKRKIKTGKFDYILIGQILPLGTVVWLLSLFKPLKYGVFLHGMDFTYALKVPRKKWLARQILKRAAKIICANSHVANQVKEFYPNGEEKIAVVNPGIITNPPKINPLEVIELKTKYNLTGKTILFSLGRLTLRKGVDQTIKALTQIPQSLNDQIVYFVAGRGQAEKHLRALVPNDWKEKIIFLDELTDDTKWLWLTASDIFIMPARDIAGDFEGFGIVYLEANLCGKPVIAGDSGGVRDAVVDGFSGILVNPENEISIKEAIIRLMTDGELRQKLGRQGQERAEKEFNWEKQVAKLVKIIKNEK